MLTLHTSLLYNGYRVFSGCKNNRSVMLTLHTSLLYNAYRVFPGCKNTAGAWRWPLTAASCTMGTGSFQGVKNNRSVTLTPHTLLVSWSRKSRTVLPVQSLSAYTRVNFTLFYLRQSSSSHNNMHIVYQFIVSRLSYFLFTYLRSALLQRP